MARDSGEGVQRPNLWSLRNTGHSNHRGGAHSWRGECVSVCGCVCALKLKLLG